MKAADFLYHRPVTVAEALNLLRDYAGDARVLAGGQSLMPMLNLRLSRPSALIDIGALEDLDRVEVEGEKTKIGARTPYWRIENDSLIADRLPMLPQMIRYVGDRQVRNRGTFGGSLVQCDPTGEMPLATLVLGGQIEVMRAGGQVRRIAAEDFFDGSYAAAIDPDELLMSVRFGRHPDYFAFSEVNRRHNDFAVVSVAVAADLGESGALRNVRVGLGGVDETPLLAHEAMVRAEGAVLNSATIAEIAAIGATACDPPDDIRASAEYRRHLTEVYIARTLEKLRTATDAVAKEETTS